MVKIFEISISDFPVSDNYKSWLLCTVEEILQVSVIELF